MRHGRRSRCELCRARAGRAHGKAEWPDEDSSSAVLPGVLPAPLAWLATGMRSLLPDRGYEDSDPDGGRAGSRTLQRQAERLPFAPSTSRSHGPRAVVIDRSPIAVVAILIDCRIGWGCDSGGTCESSCSASRRSMVTFAEQVHYLHGKHLTINRACNHRVEWWIPASAKTCDGSMELSSEPVRKSPGHDCFMQTKAPHQAPPSSKETLDHDDDGLPATCDASPVGRRGSGGERWGTK